MANPLGQLPVSNSQKFTLDGSDWQKILRCVLTQAIGLFLTFVPLLIGYKYEYNGRDYTPIVLMVVNTLAEAARRFLTNSGAQPPLAYQQTPETAAAAPEAGPQAKD